MAGIRHVARCSSWLRAVPSDAAVAPPPPTVASRSSRAAAMSLVSGASRLLCVTRAALEASFAEIAAGSFCPTQTLGNDTRGASGSLALNADLTYSMSVTVTGTTEFNVPASCLGGASCADVSASLHAEIAAGLHPGILSGSCSGASNCLCHEVLSQPLSGSGTYSTAGTALTADGVLGDSQYCVQGSTVHFLATAMLGMPQVDSVGVRQ